MTNTHVTINFPTKLTALSNANVFKRCRNARPCVQVKLVQVLGAQVTAGEPEVLVLKPILVLRRAEFATQQRRSCFAVLVHCDAILKKARNPINDLSSRFHFQFLLSARDLVG